MEKLGAVALSADILEKANIGLWAFELDDGFAPRMYVDNTMLKLLGLTEKLPPEQIYRAWYDRISDSHYKEVSTGVEKMISGVHAEVQYPWKHPDGTFRVVRCGGVRNYSYKKGVRIEGCHQDITELVHYQKKGVSDFLAALSDDFATMFFVDAKTGKYEVLIQDYESDISETLIKVGIKDDFYTAAKASAELIVYEADVDLLFSNINKDVFTKIIDSGKSIIFDMRWYAGNDNRIIWVRIKLIRHLEVDGSYKVVVGFENITEQKEQEIRLKSALADPLTGCKNRMALNWAYDGDYDTEESVAVLECDLNGLKKKNDNEGHSSGDAFICRAGTLLKDIFGKDNVYRVGGDEFVIIERGLSRFELEEQVREFERECRKQELSISIGCEFKNNFKESFEKLLKRADAKMYQAKREYYRREKRRNNRELYSRGEGILIVDDSEINRDMLREFLEENYTVFDAEDGYGAIDILKEHYEEIGLVLTDIHMPNCNGYELISLLQDDYKYKDIPIIVETAFGDEESKIRCLELGATDFVLKPYNRNVILNRIESVFRLNQVSIALSTIEYDNLTGLYTKEAFYEYAQKILDNNPDEDYVIEVSDIVGFKAINEQYGMEKAEELLRYIAETGKRQSLKGFIIGGRIGGNTFACMRSVSAVNQVMDREAIKQVHKAAPITNVVIKFGAYKTTLGRDIGIQRMCDRALMALASIKDEYGTMFAEYNETMIQKMLMEQKIIDGMERAIDEEQFEVYFQPKYDIFADKMAGAEALVRWIHPEIGFMNPGVFIPLFEKNGFITEVDKFIWKKVCEEVSYWEKQGKEFPISVNVSRRDFSDPGLADYIIGICDEYKVPYNMLHIEVTESAYSENPQQLKAIISKLHKKGFVIELDDFGTGYSSITALNGMDIDIIKLDMSIIREDNVGSEKSVLELSMELAKMMNVETVQEGVETKEQLDRVKELGCNYVQGYYFSRPLPKEEFKQYVLENFRD